MKKLFKKIILPVIALGCFTACEDVPAPYFIQEQEENDPSKTGIFLSETFASSLGKFKVVTEEAEGYSWANSYSTAYISGYQNSVNKATKTWLVSPSFDLTGQDAVQAVFDYVLRYKRTTTKELLRVSADYVGDVTTATWYDLDIKMTEGKDYTTFYSTGANLPAEVLNQPNVVVALYYEAGDKEASTWEVKNLMVKKGEYEENGNGTTPTNDTTREKPFSVSQAIASQNGNAWVKGYIVGCVEGQKLAEGAKFEAVSGVASNILIAESADETEVGKCLVVQLPVGDVRKAINLSDNPNNIKQEVILYGSLETYFGAPGMKSTSFAIFNGKGYGTDPDKTVVLEPKGDGTLESPFNPAAAIQYAQSLGSDVNSTNDVYIKGRIVEFNTKDGNFGSNTYGNASFYIAEEGAEDVKFYCFRVMYFGKTKYQSGNIPQLNDEVVICGKVVNYKGNTPETVANEAYLYSINGITDGGESGNTETPTGGTYNEPFSVAKVIETYVDGKQIPSYVKGYIVGYVDGNGYNAETVKFEVPAEAQTEILIADSPNETDITKCVPVQLPKGDIRTGLELMAHPEYLGQQVLLYGSIENYFKIPGLKGTSYAEIGGTVIGSKPE